ncbi:uncharacterized protein LOC110732506 isoform X2 [Chenopodium quinoa]|uniref:uncharacterized protein LOC110732506 isoform X2 n=1 Tax=Chenopodium quinoa TaxID=63459 RepID=UPI000B77395E|nr:uncharacterized protein LOC110732506 isoform X2 [Chenopodium quinoa]
MESDGKMVKTSKTLVQFDQSTTIISSSSVVEKESCGLDLTSSALMGARVTKSQANGSGVIGEESVHDNNSIDGGAAVGGAGDGVGDNLSVANESLTTDGTRVGMIVDGENGADGCVIDKGIAECKIDEKLDGSVTGNVASGVSKEVRGKGFGAKFQDGRNSSERKPFDDVSSSIAQRTRNRAVTGKKEDIGDVDDGQKGSEVGDVDDEENVFLVGDFVWGKVKSHPWWPGRIHDPSNASEFALKYKHEGRILVAYFGDRTFAWCDTSQLKSFEENFEEMSKQSSLKTFVTAVEEAQNEFGRLVKLQMTCSCARESQSSLPFVVNAGVKEGVHVPENGIAKFSVAQLDMSAMLADIRRMAIFDLLANTLELPVLKSRLLAKFGYSLPIYCEPMGIEDPVNEQGVPRETSFRGPDDGDWFIGSEDQTLGQNDMQTPPHDMSHRRRKTKSIADLLGMDTKDKLESDMDGIEENSQLGKSVVKSGKRKRKVADEDQSSMPVANGDDGFSKDEELLGKQFSISSRKRRKTVDETQRVTDDSMITRSSSRKKKEDSVKSRSSSRKAKEDSVKSRSSSRKTKEDSVKSRSSSRKTKEDSVKSRSSSRKTKEDSVKSRSSSRNTKEDSVKSTTSDKKASGDGGGEVKNKQKMNIVPQVSTNGGPTAEEGYERISPRERKLSKYLSPPYTNLLQRQRSSCSQTSSEARGLEFSDVANTGERIAKTAGKLVGSTPLVKCSAETLQKPSKVSGSKHEKIDHPDQNRSKPDLISEENGPEKSIDSLNGVLREIHSAALDPLCTRRDQNFDSIKGFVSSYRSSNYRNGPNYKIYKKGLADDQRRKRKRNSSGTMHGSDSEHKVLNDVDQQTLKRKPSKRSATKREQKSESKPDNEVSCEPSSSSATLVITFPAGFSLPTKENIIGMCCKFGDLDESKTEVISELFTAKIVFVHRSYAEAAVDSMQKSLPFGTAEVSYKIQYLASVSSKGKQVNVQNKKKMKSTESTVAKSPDKQPFVSPNSPSPEGEPLAVIFIKQKLKAMTSMLGETDGKMSEEIKSNLENEVKELLKKVKKMTATSS